MLRSATMSSSGVVGQSIQSAVAPHSRAEPGSGGEAMAIPRMSEAAFGKLVAQVRAEVDGWLREWLASA
jgi:hypothetical protein